MAGKKIAEGVFEPEELAGLNVKWDKYTPPGGYAWQEMFSTCGKDGLNAALQTCIDRQNEIASIGVEVAALRKGFEAFGKLMDSLDSNLGKRIMETISDDTDKVENWRTENKKMSEEIGEALRGFSISDDEKRSVETDIAFLKALENFFTNDLQLDLLLYGISKVDAKYRTKIFRSIMKTLKECEEAMNVIDHSPSELKVVIMREHYGMPYKELSNGYAKLGANLRLAKKQMDKRGPAFWDSDTMVESLMKVCENDQAFRAMSQWSWTNN